MTKDENGNKKKDDDKYYTTIQVYSLPIKENMKSKETRVKWTAKIRALCP